MFVVLGDAVLDVCEACADAKASVLEDCDKYTAKGVLSVPEAQRWSDLRAAAKQPDVAQRVDTAMDAIERENPSLLGVLPMPRCPYLAFPLARRIQSAGR
ncbi:MAG: hypothetical protein QM286_10930 [Acidobacteriota bacterium]|nr:hypothetical protein [Acidobacteriota bacterium]NLH69903.1 SAM-dependent DNA methyltransferase [Brooklawnia sp.]